MPGLVLFLGLGMLVGSDVPRLDLLRRRRAGSHDRGRRGVADPVRGRPGVGLARAAAGARSPRSRLRILGTVDHGGGRGLAAAWIFDLSVKEGLLVGAVIAATDGAAIFAVLRTSALERRLALTLEGE